MKNHLTIEFKQFHLLYRFIIFLVLVTLNDLLAKLLNFNLPITRYLFAAFSMYYLAYSIKIQRKNLLGVGLTIKSLVYILLIWTIVMIIMGLPQVFSGYKNNTYLKIFVSGQYLLYLLPVTLLINPNILFYKKLIKLIALLSIIYLVFTIPLLPYFLKDVKNGVEVYAVFFAASSTLLILTYPYHSQRINILMLLSNLTALILTAYFARRNQLVYFSSVLFFTGLSSLMGSSTLLKRKRNVFLLSSFTISMLILVILLLFSVKFDLLIEKANTGFSSRETEINDFVSDFNDKNDWIIGRGINGEVYSSRLANFDENKETRSGIENGYYQGILKGGFIYLGLFILLSIFASFKGFFRSNNLLSKAFAAIIIINLIDMIGFGLPALNIRYVMIWIAIGGCLSPWLRSLDDHYLASQIGLKQLIK